MQHPVIKIIESLCREFGEDGICGVGITAALRAMSAYWIGHLAEGNHEEIIYSDIGQLDKLLRQMRSEIFQRMQQQKQSVGQLACSAPASVVPCRYDVGVIRIGYRSCTLPVSAISREEAEMLALQQAGDHEFPSEHDADYEVCSVKEKRNNTDGITAQTADVALLATAIAAEVHTDSHLLKAEFDAAPWFSQADDKEIIELHAIEWRGNYASDEVAKFFESSNTEIAALLSYCRVTHDTRRAEGFECSVDADQAMIWLKQHRHGLWARLLCKDNGIQLLEEQRIRGIWGWFDDDNNHCDVSFSSIEEAALNAVTSLDLDQ